MSGVKQSIAARGLVGLPRHLVRSISAFYSPGSARGTSAPLSIVTSGRSERPAALLFLLPPTRSALTAACAPGEAQLQAKDPHSYSARPPAAHLSPLEALSQ